MGISPDSGSEEVTPDDVYAAASRCGRRGASDGASPPQVGQRGVVDTKLAEHFRRVLAQ